MRALALLALLAAPPALAQGSVWIVDETGAGDFVDIQPAIDVASSGDVIVVRSGSYGGFVLTTGLTVTADTSASVLLDSTISVKGLPERETAILRGLIIEDSTWSWDVDPIPGIVIASNKGTVWIEESDLAGSYKAPGAVIFDSRSVVLHNVVITGAGGYPWTDFTYGFVPGPGLVSTGSTVSAYGSTITGGEGRPGGYANGSDTWGSVGEAGVSCSGGFLFLGNCSVTGGKGGDSSLTEECFPSQDGGPGIQARGSAALYTAQETTISGGQPGWHDCFGQGGEAGPAIGSGVVDELGGTPTSLNLELPLRAGTTSTYTLTGVPGSAVFLGISVKPDFAFASALLGPLLVDFPAQVSLVGTLSPAGSLSLPLAIPNLPLGFASTTLFVQAAFLQNGITLGPAIAATTIQ